MMNGSGIHNNNTGLNNMSVNSERDLMTMMSKDGKAVANSLTKEEAREKDNNDEPYLPNV